MVVNFSVRGINRGMRKLARTPTLILKKKNLQRFSFLDIFPCVMQNFTLFSSTVKISTHSYMLYDFLGCYYMLRLVNVLERKKQIH
jgi:hypothetical protein